jgi:hypothetical protein
VKKEKDDIGLYQGEDISKGNRERAKRKGIERELSGKESRES